MTDLAARERDELRAVVEFLKTAWAESIAKELQAKHVAEREKDRFSWSEERGELEHERDDALAGRDSACNYMRDVVAALADLIAADEADEAAASKSTKSTKSTELMTDPTTRLAEGYETQHMECGCCGRWDAVEGVLSCVPCDVPWTDNHTWAACEPGYLFEDGQETDCPCTANVSCDGESTAWVNFRDEPGMDPCPCEAE